MKIVGLLAIPSAHGTDKSSARQMDWQEPGRIPRQQTWNVPSASAQRTAPDAHYNYGDNCKCNTLHDTTLDYTTLRYTTLQYTTLQYSTLHAIPLHQFHHHNHNCNYDCATLITPHYNYNSATLHYTTTTTTTATATATAPTTALHHTTSSSCGRGDHCNRCNHSKKHNSNHLSVHQSIRSATNASQLLSSPMVLSLKLPPPPRAVLLVS